MKETEMECLTPFRIQQIMKTASEAMSLIVNGKHLYSPSYQECEIVVELMAEALRKGKEGSEKNTQKGRKGGQARCS